MNKQPFKLFFVRKGMFLLSFILIFFVAACSSQEAPREIELKPYTLADLAKQDFSNIDMITIKSGATGEEKTFEDQEQISKFLKNMENAYFTPDINQEKRSGWTYWIALYEGRDKVFEFYPNNIDDIYFEPDEKVVASIEELFNSYE